MDDIWAAAALLVERRRGPAPAALDAAAIALGQRRLERWRRQPPFDDPVWFARRLRSLGCSEAEFVALLGEPAAALAERIGAPWLADQPPLDAAPQTTVATPLAAVLAPWLARAERSLSAALRHFAQRDVLLPQLLDQLARRLERMLERSVALELHIAREQGQLAGTSSGERFASFVALLGTPAARLSLLRDYPGLARQLALGTASWVAGVCELLERLERDRDQLALQFDVDAETLTALHTGRGDSHAGGRSVVRLEFGAGATLACKPRPQALAAWFQTVLSWVNERGWAPTFRVLHILDRGDYGWVAWEAAAPCADTAAVERFYKRLGGLLGLLTLVQATDIHLENILAAGEHPLVIDCETLMHPPLPWPTPDTASSWLHVQHSVLRCALLPQRFAAAPDLSGIGGQGASVPGEVWADYQGEHMRIIEGRQAFAAGRNQPHTASGRVDPLAHWSALEAGCVALLELAQCERSALSRMLATCAALPVRCVPRPSQVYAHLRTQSWHPSVLVRGLEQQLVLDRLWAAAPQWPWLAALIPAEQADLAAGDVPLFTSRPDSRRLWSSRGAPLPVTLPATALERAQAWLASLDAATVAAQRTLLRESAVVLARQGAPPRTTPVVGAVAPTRRVRMALALRCGVWLEQHAVATPFGCIWHGPQRRADGDFDTGPLSAACGDGLAGVALFGALLARCGGGWRWRQLAQVALTTLRQQQRQLAPGGVWHGAGGVVLAIIQTARWLDDLGALDLASAIARASVERAGPALALAWLGLWQSTGAASWLERAQQHSDHLELGAESWLDGPAGAALVAHALADATGSRRPTVQPASVAETLALWPWEPQPALLDVQMAALLARAASPDDWQLIAWAARVARRRDWATRAAALQAGLAEDWRAGRRFATPRNTPAPGLRSGAAGCGWAMLAARPPLAVLAAVVQPR